MTLTVRLPVPIEEALEAYSAEKGLTKSHVVQEALAQYLAHSKKAVSGTPRKVSETYRALKKAGLIGCFRGDGVSATKDVVRRRVLDSLEKRR
jgi:hypothetical protein